MDQKNNPPATDIKIDMAFDPHDHNYVQRGYFIECDGNCKVRRAHGHSIPSGQMLAGKRGDWKIVPEGGLMKPQPA